MVQISTSDLRGGNKIELEDQPYVVVNIEFVKPGKGRAFNKIRVKNLLTGRVLDKTFNSTDKVEEADVEEKQMRMLYREPDGVVFMDDNSYEQVTISAEHIGDNDKWLMENQVYSVLFYKGNAINLDPPTFMILKIVETDPGVRGDTASGRVLKPAILETGAKVQVPIFVEQDETIKVDTRTGDYVSRATE
jgi:elongation factor P